MAKKSITNEKASSSKVSKHASRQKDLTEEVRKIAYSLFEKRGCTLGRDLDDWLEAERQLKKH